MTEGQIPFFKPEIGDEEVRAVTAALSSGWLTTGPRTAEFEQQFANYVGAENAVAVNSGTAALHLALAAMGIGHDHEVIIPTMTFAATAEVAIHLGAQPILVDSEPHTLNMDPSALERAISPRTRAVIPVHYGGQAAEMDEIQDIASRHGIRVIEDAAHALPASYHGRTIGTISEATCFSFYANKTMTTGEGGMVTTADSKLSEHIRLLSLHGLSKDAWGRFKTSSPWDYDIVAPGYKYNPTDISSAIGLEQLRRADRFRELRVSQANRYDEHFAEQPAIQPLGHSANTRHAHHLYVVVLDADQIGPSRNAVIEALGRKGIGTSVHYRPLHLHSLYQRRYGYKAADFPVATSMFSRVISLPIYPSLTTSELDRVAEALIQAVHGD